MIFSEWSNNIYPCSKECGFVGGLNAFKYGECYKPCPNCGSPKTNKTGRFVYQLVPIRWIPFIKRKVFVKVEWLAES